MHLREKFARPAATLDPTYRTKDSSILSYSWHLHLTHKYPIFDVKNRQPLSFKMSFRKSYTTHLTASPPSPHKKT